MMSSRFMSLWLPVCAWCLLIFFFSSLPSVSTPLVVWWDVLLKKTAHVFEFFVLHTLVFRALVQTKPRWPVTTLLAVSILFCNLYAVSDEFHQRFTPGRTPTIRDMVIDFAAVGLSAWYIHISQYNQKSTFRQWVFGAHK